MTLKIKSAKFVVEMRTDFHTFQSLPPYVREFSSLAIMHSSSSFINITKEVQKLRLVLSGRSALQSKLI
jgi:hypothetical protein